MTSILRFNHMKLKNGQFLDHDYKDYDYLSNDI